MVRLEGSGDDFEGQQGDGSSEAALELDGLVEQAGPGMSAVVNKDLLKHDSFESENSRMPCAHRATDTQPTLPASTQEHEHEHSEQLLLVRQA